MVQPGQNRHLRFTGAEVHTVYTSRNRETIVLDIHFEDFRHRFFDPGSNREEWKPSWYYLAHFCDIAGVDVTQIPYVYSWEDLVDRWAKIVNREAKNTLMFVKITLNENSFKCFGQIPCFSNEPDLLFTEDDLKYYQPVGENDIEIVDLPE